MIPHGYKHTAIGIIPQEWDVKQLVDCFDISAGRDLIKECFSKTPTADCQFPIFSNSLENKGLYGYTSKPRHKAGCVTITGRGALGVAEYREEDFDAIVRLLVLSPKVEIGGKFIAEYINYRKPFFFESTGVPQLTAPQISKTLIPVPPMEEQRKIAEILGVWDKAIELQARIIDKLEQRKRALMQCLLSGRHRLPGFSTPWQIVRMEQLFDIIDEVNDGNIHIPMTISAKYGFISQQNKFDRIIAGDSLKRYTLIKQGDFAYNKGNSNLYEMGCIYSLKEQSALVPFVYICFRAKDGVCIEFYSQYFINHGLDQQLRKIITSGARGDGLLNVDKHDFFALKVPYPTYDEQSSIANILLMADKEIELAKSKLAAYRTQKRGLMQQLLTGKKRVNL